VCRLSQRLVLDINTTAYVSEPSLIAYEEAILEQITNHMWVCGETGEGTETMRGIASSEPTLSEVASFVMRHTRNFDLAGALSEVLSEFLTNLGDRGEL
jgi:hypothetical protein